MPVKKAKGPRTGLRITFMVLAWILVAGLVLQPLLFGLGHFYQPKYLGMHAGLGWSLAHLVAPIVLILGLFARLGRQLIIVSVVDLVLLGILPILAAMRQDNGLAAAFHPVVAVAVLILTFYLAIKVRPLVPAPWGTVPRGQTMTPAVPATPPPRGPATGR